MSPCPPPIGHGWPNRRKMPGPRLLVRAETAIVGPRNSPPTAKADLVPTEANLLKVNRPDFDGDSGGWDSRGRVGRALLTVVRRFVLRRRHVPAGRVEAPLVPPLHPGRGRQLDLVSGAPRPLPADQLGLVEAVHGLGEGVVVGIAAGAD